MPQPTFFLADLPPEAALTPTLLTEACLTLRRNRQRYLQERSTASLIAAWVEVGRSWLTPDSPWRRELLTHGPDALGFPRATLERGVHAFFGQLTPETLEHLIEQELGHPQRLDQWTALPPERASQRAAVTCGPELLVHVTAGILPSPAWASLVLGLLTRSAQFFQGPAGSSLAPRLLAHSLYALEPKLGACLEIAEWPDGSEKLESVLFAQADAITASGSEETLAAIRRRIPPRTHFLGCGHRISFGFVSQRALAQEKPQPIAARAAADVAAWNQWGCLAPHLFYVEDGGRGEATTFAENLAAALDQLETSEPRGPVPAAVDATLASRRAFYQIRAAHSPETRLWSSPNSTAWTVVWEADPRFQLSCRHRFVYVKAVKDLAEALAGADPVRAQVATVGLAALPDQTRALAWELAQWGATRICPIGRMQQPALGGRPDGRPPLGNLVRWIDWEQ